MRILIADRNAWLLESIARTFAHQFTIQTGTTQEQCNELLGRAEFDLVVVSEKLADGRGLQLLAQIACNSPDTLRVFAARPSRLELLKGKLGRFGLFRTISYPINPQELLSALTLARTGLEVEVPAPRTPEVLRKSGEVTVRTGTSTVVPATVARPTAERISLTSARALFTADVPKMIGLKISPPAQPVRPQTTNVAAQPARPQLARVQPIQVELTRAQSAGVQPARARPTQAELARAQIAGVPLVRARPTQGELARAQIAGVQLVRTRPTQAELARAQVAGVQLARAQPAGVQPARGQHSAPPPARPRVAADPAAPLESQTFQPMSAVPGALSNAALRSVGPISAGRGRGASGPLPSVRAYRSPVRTKVALGMTVVLVFLVTTVTLHRLDASAHVIHASAPPLAQVEQPVAVAPPSPAVSLTPAFQPTPHVAQHVQPKPDAEPDAAQDDQQLAASTTPVADPSTFGSEAYEAIYSN